DLTFGDPSLFRHLRGTEGPNQAQALHRFFTVLALCHTAVVDEGSSSESKRIIYKAESPDEKALVGAAADVGFAFLRRQRTTITLSVLGEEQTWEQLQILAFDSTRKRMSVVVRRVDEGKSNDPTHGHVLLMTKGADNVIMERLAPGQDEKIRKT
ncbi:hypothetical protein BJ684DRAFT_3510, partial [Piptocephalis cylindrospora]